MRAACLRKMLGFAAALLTSTSFPAGRGDGFALSNLFSDAMVLQAEAPTLFGTCTASCKINVTIIGTTAALTSCAAGGDWKVVFPGRPASDPAKPGTTITVEHSCADDGDISSTSTPTYLTTLNDVLFGDIWVCGGAYTGVLCCLYLRSSVVLPWHPQVRVTWSSASRRLLAMAGQWVG